METAEKVRERLSVELRQLDERRTRLLAFLNRPEKTGNLDRRQLTLLRLQYSAMGLYRDILEERMELLSSTPEGASKEADTQGQG